MIWNGCSGEQHIQTVQGLLYRLVESQQQIATLSYVDTLEEQALLEDMLEAVKPLYSKYIESTGSGSNGRDLHYLLKSPFRYPPLQWGSRFGQRHEMSIFYGGLDLHTTLAESAYYRFIFLFSMEGEPIKKNLRTEHTLLLVDYKSSKGVRLQNEPFNAYQTELTNPQHYQISQQLGSDMRAANVDAFEYCSARRPSGLCVGLFTPNALVQHHPKSTSQWLCVASLKEVSFKSVDAREVTKFAIEDFLVDGRFPFPA